MTPEAIDALFEAQLQAWPELRAGVESLARMRRRELDIHGVRCIVLHIPHRIGSTTASTESFRRRS